MLFRIFSFIYLAFSLYSVQLTAQTKPLVPSRYWIQFKHKGHTPFSLSRPLEFLSAYSIERKLLHNIKIDSLDLPVDPSYIDSIKSKGPALLNCSRWLNAITVQLHDSAELFKILKLPFVNATRGVATGVVQQVCGDDIENSFTPADTLLYGVSYHQLQMINLPVLHAYGYKGDGIRIAVLDAGFKFADKWKAFDSLFIQNRISDHWDFVRHRGDSTFYWNEHGADVLSTIEANLPGVYMGAAPRASVALYHTEDAATENVIEEDNWCSGAERADSLGIDIISSSLGYTTFDSTCFCNASYADMNGHTTHISIAATIAARKGILVCSSAGNEGNNSWYHISAPADADSILAVGAVNDTGGIASFSSRGPTADGRIKPDVDALGVHTWLIDPLSGNVGRGSGTSFSNPIMAGAAACLWQICPHASNMDVRQAIIQSSNRYTHPDNNYGYGIPDMVKAANLLYQYSYCNTYDSHNNPFKTNIVTLSPNPAHNTVNLTFVADSLSPVTISWYDITGRTMVEKKFTPALIGVNSVSIANVAQWASGVYFARIFIGGVYYTKRVVVSAKP